MSADRAEAIAVAWDCVVRAETANRKQLEALAVRITDVLVEEPLAGAYVMHRAASDRLVHRLWLLADAAPIDRYGPLDRLAAAATAEFEELEDRWESDDEDDEEDDFDELPA